jgi:UDP-glucuronate decarboxylase
MNLEDGRVVSNFIYQALQNQDLTVYGDGLQTRSFCFVSDLVEALVKFTESKVVPTGPINLGNPKEFTMLELAEKVISAAASKSRVIHSELPMDDPKQRKPDITIAKEILSWTPKIELDEGLSITINDFEKRMRTLNLI